MYSESVAEVDKKPAQLCPDCQQAFDKVFGRTQAPAASGPATAPK